MNGDSKDTEDKNSNPAKDIAVLQDETNHDRIEEGGKVCPTKTGDPEHVKNGEEENESNLHDITTFEDLLQMVGTRGRWNVLLLVLCAYGTVLVGYL